MWKRLFLAALIGVAGVMAAEHPAAAAEPHQASTGSSTAEPFRAQRRGADNAEISRESLVLVAQEAVDVGQLLNFTDQQHQERVRLLTFDLLLSWKLNIRTDMRLLLKPGELPDLGDWRRCVAEAYRPASPSLSPADLEAAITRAGTDWAVWEAGDELIGKRYTEHQRRRFAKYQAQKVIAIEVANALASATRSPPPMPGNARPAGGAPGDPPPASSAAPAAGSASDVPGPPRAWKPAPAAAPGAPLGD